MAELGKYNELEVLKEVPFGVYLDGGEEFGEILLPGKYVPSALRVGQKINVFLYTDSEDRIVATTEKPKAILGDIACLEVVSVSEYGAFLDWGLSKDLLLPMGEQKGKVKPGDLCVVKIFLHERTERLAATQKLNKFLKKTAAGNYAVGQEVSLIVINKTDLGYSAIVNGEHWGLLFDHEIFEPLSEGAERKGFIQNVRADGKIDLTLTKPGYEKVDGISRGILEQLKAQGGFLKLTDKTPPEVIYSKLKMSKKNFKKAIGALYKQRLIVIEEEGIRLV